MYDQILEYNPNLKNIKWHHLTDYFMKSLLEIDN